MNNLSAKTAMITGAASGIGLATASAFAQAGYNLVLTDVNASLLSQSVVQLQQYGVQVVTLARDITDTQTAAECVETAVRDFGGLDAAVNCAGITGSLVPTADCEDNWNLTIAVNLTAIWRCNKFQIRQMLEQSHGGAIVNISSTAGLRGYDKSPAYAASKHGVIGLTRSAALDYGDRGIRINALCPGFIRTPMTAAVVSNEKPDLVESMGTPIGRVGEPSEVAEAALWLCSDSASFVLGETLRVDGGHLA